MNLKNRLVKLESSECGFTPSLVEALLQARERALQHKENPAPTITEDELKNILATHGGDSLAAKLARAKLRCGLYIA